ncbi:MAG: hypothetical protein OEU26_19605 [Candidatus Tectomicrobia bacterium]|nr:hypothetical protein [Candidatus Tectomicrobia bacterium]
MPMLRKLVAIIWLVLGLLMVGSLATPLPVIILKAIAVGSGLGLITVGVWWLRHPLFPADRDYALLRGEVDQFLALVRKLHQASRAVRDVATPVYCQGFDEIQQAMRASVERMVVIAHVADTPTPYVSPDQKAR